MFNACNAKHITAAYRERDTDVMRCYSTTDVKTLTRTNYNHCGVLQSVLDDERPSVVTVCYGTVLRLFRPFPWPPPVSSDCSRAVSRGMIFTGRRRRRQLWTRATGPSADGNWAGPTQMDSSPPGSHCTAVIDERRSCEAVDGPATRASAACRRENDDVRSDQRGRVLTGARARASPNQRAIDGRHGERGDGCRTKRWDGGRRDVCWSLHVNRDDDERDDYDNIVTGRNGTDRRRCAGWSMSLVTIIKPN
ncbi:hypothetical protein AGLY_012060, partial [Aphis glycines]